MSAEHKADSKILIVDDQFGIRILLTEVLQTEGYNTFQAANGVQALSFIEQKHPDLVLLDMKIPGMNGLEVLKGIKNKSLHTKVIMMTAYGEMDMIEEAKRNGAIAHFTKPFDINDVLKSVKTELPL